MKIIEWPVGNNDIVQNRKPKTIEEWAEIQGVTKEDIGEKAWAAVVKWFSKMESK